MLTSEQAGRHEQEVLLQFLVLLALGRQLVHAAHQCSIHPAVATAPVAVLAVFLLVGRHVVGVAPPKSGLLVEQSATTGVTAPAVHLHGVVAILLLTCQTSHLHVERHGHLDSVDPRPPTVQFSVGFLHVGRLHLVVQVCYDVGQQFAVVFLGVGQQLNVGLAAALVVGIARSDAVTRRPLVEVGPS